MYLTGVSLQAHKPAPAAPSRRQAACKASHSKLRSNVAVLAAEHSSSSIATSCTAAASPARAGRPLVTGHAPGSGADSRPASAAVATPDSRATGAMLAAQDCHQAAGNGADSRPASAAMTARDRVQGGVQHVAKRQGSRGQNQPAIPHALMAGLSQQQVYTEAVPADQAMCSLTSLCCLVGLCTMKGLPQCRTQKRQELHAACNKVPVCTKYMHWQSTADMHATTGKRPTMSC